MARPPLFQRATVTRIVKETDDARTYVLAPVDGPFTYQAGQFCTFKVNVDGTDLYRSYSMSSSPETDTEMMTTIKRVPGGKVSNWLHDNVAEGDQVEITRPAGTFLLREGEGPSSGSPAAAASPRFCRSRRARSPPPIGTSVCSSPIATAMQRSSTP